MQSKSSNSCAFGIFLTGFAIGMATAMLVAPKSGRESREDLRNTFNSAKNNLGDKAASTKDVATAKLNQALETTKTVASESTRAAKQAKQRVKEQKSNIDSTEPKIAENENALKPSARGYRRT